MADFSQSASALSAGPRLFTGLGVRGPVHRR